MTAANTDNNTAFSPAAELFLQGWQCFHGQSLPQDFAGAAVFWERAAAMGDALALYNLACLYMHGHGVAADHTRGRELLEQASAAGCIRARDSLRDIAKVGQSSFQVYDKDINFERRRLYVIAAVVVILVLVAITIITIPNRLGIGGL